MKARKEEILVGALAEETVLYDLTSHEVHCLNRTLAAVWKHCDGRNAIEELVSLVQEELGQKVNGDLIWLSLEQLEQAGLLAEPLPRPNVRESLSRREVAASLGFVGMLGALMPALTSLVAPTVAEAASGEPDGTICGTTASHSGHFCISNGVICASGFCFATHPGAGKVCICG